MADNDGNGAADGHNVTTDPYFIPDDDTDTEAPDNTEGRLSWIDISL